MMRNLFFISPFFALLIGCSNPPEKKAKNKKIPTVTQEDVRLVKLDDGLGIPKVMFEGEPFTGVVEGFQGYYVADYLKDSLDYTTGQAFYTDGMLDSVYVPRKAEKRYFNGDNFIDSIYMEVVMEDGTERTQILYFENELLTNMKVIVHE